MTVPLFIRDRVGADELAAVIAGALVMQTLPGVFLMLLGGVIADRVEPRLIFVRATAVAAAVSAVYIVLSAADVTIVWPVFALSAVVGAVAAFEQPARQGVLPQMVTRPQLQNAVILGNVGFLAAGAVRSAVAGRVRGRGCGVDGCVRARNRTAGAGSAALPAPRALPATHRRSARHSQRPRRRTAVRAALPQITGPLALAAMPASSTPGRSR